MPRKGCGKMAMDNSCARTTDEESEHPPHTSCSQMALHSRTEKADNSCATKPDNLYLLLTVKKGGHMISGECKKTVIKVSTKRRGLLS